MHRYMYIFRGVDGVKRRLSAAEQEELLGRWSAWAASLRDQGAMKGGSRLAADGAVVGATGVVSDGPFAESKEVIGGFFIVECADLAAATAGARRCPGLEYPEITVEVRPVAGQ